MTRYARAAVFGISFSCVLASSGCIESKCGLKKKTLIHAEHEMAKNNEAHRLKFERRTLTVSVPPANDAPKPLEITLAQDTIPSSLEMLLRPRSSIELQEWRRCPSSKTAVAWVEADLVDNRGGKAVVKGEFHTNVSGVPDSSTYQGTFSPAELGWRYTLAQPSYSLREFKTVLHYDVSKGVVYGSVYAEVDLAPGSGASVEVLRLNSKP